MTDSKRLAGLLGSTLIALAATEAMNPQIWSGEAHLQRKAEWRMQ